MYTSYALIARKIRAGARALDKMSRDVYSKRPTRSSAGVDDSCSALSLWEEAFWSHSLLRSIEACGVPMKGGLPEWRSMTVTTLTIMTALIVVLGLALEAAHGNGGGHGLTHALTVLKQGTAAEKLKALELLARLGDMQVIPALVQALRDDDARVRAAAQHVMWAIWLRSGNDQIDALMAQGIHLMESQQYPEAVEIFDQIIGRAPKFAEGYNKRATVYYLMQEFEQSIADIHRTLELNPVHFGALSGMGLCYLGLDEPRKALEWFERAVAVNPDMDTIQHYIQQIREFLKDQTF
jgi:tetratricopeptide (TPR) repeat protein